MSVGLQSTGQIIVDGDGTFGGVPGVVALVRLNANGSVDTTFGTNGLYTESRMCVSTAMTILSNDEIVAVGNGRVNGERSDQFWVTEVLANGSSYDSTFGTSGLAEANFSWVNPNIGVLPTSVEIEPDGDIAVTGQASGDLGFVTAEFLGGSSNNEPALRAVGAPATPNTPNPALVPIVLEQSLFLDAIANSKHRRSD
jgi:hypothetical protein